MRRIAVVASGSMGDVRPYAVLAAAFGRAGWDAGLVANNGYRALAASLDVPWFVGALPALESVIAWQRRQNAQEGGLFSAELWDGWFASYPNMVAALAGADVVLSRIPWVGDAARLLDVPFILAPNLPRIGFRADLPRVPIGARIGAMVRRRRLAQRVPGAVAVMNLVGHLGASPDWLTLLWHERRSLGGLMGLQKRHLRTLAALGDSAARHRLALKVPPLLEIVGLSRHIVPPRARERFTGAWRMPTGSYTPPPALAQLMAAGEPPIYVGFGSVPCMPNGNDFAALSRTVAEAVRRLGRRAVISPGWGGLCWPAEAEVDSANEVVVIDAVPHDWLFPRVGAVVHHCGAGTSVAAIAAGTPSVAVPFLQDEPFWGWRLHDLGVAPPPLEPARMTASALEGAIRAALHDRSIRARAAGLSTAMRAEDGLTNAVRLVEDAVETMRGRRETACGAV